MAEFLLFHPHTRHIMLNFCPLLHRFCLEFHCNTVHPWPSWRKKHLYMRLLRSGQMIIWRFQGVKYLHHGKDCLYFVFADYHSASYQYPVSILYRHVFSPYLYLHLLYTCFNHVPCATMNQSFIFVNNKKVSEWLKQIINAHRHTMTHTSMQNKQHNHNNIYINVHPYKSRTSEIKSPIFTSKSLLKQFSIDSCLNNKWKPDKNKNNESAHKTYTTTMTTPFKIEAT